MRILATIVGFILSLVYWGLVGMTFFALWYGYCNPATMLQCTRHARDVRDWTVLLVALAIYAVFAIGWGMASDRLDRRARAKRSQRLNGLKN